MMPTTMLIIAGVLALVATVLAFIYVVPEKKREKLGAFGKFLHDTCNFKYLMVEKILQALYIFNTAAVIIFGVLMLFRTEYNYWTGDRIWMGGYGLLIIILGPIAIRLSYELMMMAILLLKNVISINHKLADQTGKGSGDVQDLFHGHPPYLSDFVVYSIVLRRRPVNAAGGVSGVSRVSDQGTKKKHPGGCFFFCLIYS